MQHEEPTVAVSGAPGHPRDLRSDAALAVLAGAGDANAFAVIFTRYQPCVARYLRRHVPEDPGTAEDLVSDTFVRALGRIGHYYESPSGMRAWLLTIARNLVTDHRKLARTRLELPVFEVPEARMPPVSDPHEEVVASMTGSVVRQALTGLTEHQQQVIVMRYWMGMRARQIARMTGRTEGAVKALQWRARLDLRHSLGNRGTGWSL
ncbi:sigma-70 family RNA polymerase sigma factor [Streptomyces sp. NBC_01476]|uniref:RNA polymerase sigma factor n=1 Tax=Streptomyces sp. NBC_01476 TaxID=2903881 RepID=UPI002E37CC8A|nr:sigma-70 family RNA polymerase sigma factor [Streptomyces sp. NBC_01476]